MSLYILRLLIDYLSYSKESCYKAAEASFPGRCMEFSTGV